MVSESLHNFVSDLDQYDWFCDAGVDAFGRFVVYVNKMDLNFISKTPDCIDGYHVLFHYDHSQPPIIPYIEEVIPGPEDVDYLMTESINVSKLITDLISLKEICGTNILTDIFFESHDKFNAVTNLSVKYPDIRKHIDHLYEMYGFDIIYEQLVM